MKSVPETIVLLLVCGVVYAVTEEVETVMEGDSVTLHTIVTELKTDVDKIVWRLVENGSRPLLVEVYKNKNEYHDKRFKDRLQISSQIGSLTIKNMKTTYSGLYEADIQDGSGSPSKKFRVIVNESQRVFDDGTCEVKSMPVIDGESVTLHTDVQTHRDDLILWRFGDEGLLIAKHDKEDNKISIYYDEGFRGRLKMDDQTGSLIISGVRSSDSGLYKLKISSNNQTLYKMFSVSIKDQGLSPGQVASIVASIVCVLLTVLAVIYSCSRISAQKKETDDMKTEIVMEGEPVTLHTGLTLIQTEDELEWMFRDKVIAKLKRNQSAVDERFTGRLKLDAQTGSLTITKTITEDSGLYKLKISSSSGVKSFFQSISFSGPSYSLFSVTVQVKSVSVKEGGSVTLHTDDIDILSDDVIEWSFGKTSIIIKRDRKDSVSDGRFKGRVQVDVETGSLTIKNITADDSGPYQRRISSSRGTSLSNFNLTVTAESRPAQLGHSITLYTGVTEILTDEKIVWTFEDTKIRIAQFTGGTAEPLLYNPDDGRFKSKLKMNKTTGDLTVENITANITGDYGVEIHGKSVTRYMTFIVSIPVFAEIGNRATLNTEDVQSSDFVKWIFDDKITLATKMNGESGQITCSADERFKGRVMLDKKTGSLTITKVEPKDFGVYTLRHIDGTGRISNKKFSVAICEKTPGKDPQPSGRRRIKPETNSENESTTVVVPLLNEAEDRF